MFKIDISLDTINRLELERCLNSDLIEFYINLLMQRDHRDGIRSHYFNSWFLGKLFQGGQYSFDNIVRWIRKIPYDLLSCEKLYFPIHKPGHWVLVVVFLQACEICYLDSLKGTGLMYIQLIYRVLNDMSRFYRLNYVLDVNDWKFFDSNDYSIDIPHQTNGYDCGMFILMYMRAISFGYDIRIYNQSNMYECRLRVSDEILDGKLFEDVQAEKRQVLRARELAGLLDNFEAHQEFQGNNNTTTTMSNNIRSKKREFYRHHQKGMTDKIASDDGFSTSLLMAMKEKQKEYNRKSYEKNKEKNKEKHISKCRIYWAKNKEKVNEQRRNDWVDTVAAINTEQAEERRSNNQKSHLQQYHKKLETILMPYARQCNIDTFTDSKGEKQHK
jgi:hypothetical protein